VDDILDATATSEQLGESAGKDAAAGKATYPALFGLEASRDQARALVDEAVEAVRDLDGDGWLRAIALFVTTRLA
jgi:geranylgeranyl pyrophosphate synthase